MIFQGKNFGTTLIENGFAVVSERSYDHGKNRYIDEMKKAEKTAMENKKGLWAPEISFSFRAE